MSVPPDDRREGPPNRGEGPSLAEQPRRGLAEILVQRGLLTPDQLARAEAERRIGEDLAKAVVRLGLVPRPALMALLAEILGLGVVDLSEHRIDPAAAALLPEREALRLLAIPIGFEDDALVVAVADPTNLFAIDDIRVRTGRSVRPVLASREEIATAIARYVRAGDSVQAAAIEAASSVEDEEEIRGLAAAVDEGPVVRMVDGLIAQAIAERASDIHIEPAEGEVIIRYRVDGVLHDVTTSPRSILERLVARLKVMATMDIAERRRPQDGRIDLVVAGRPFNLRVATLPTVHGEQVVMRIHDKGSGLLPLTDLGFSSEAYRAYEASFTRPHGALLVTGPTGSGKSTTLYATLGQIASRERSVITVEDPVEYRIPGINQIQVNHQVGLSFAGALRSILRSDPDVILVGEIRDRETATVAVEAALTGHLVLSTLHTNDAASSLPRLIEMGVEPYLAASAVEAIVAQRLVRKLCSRCREAYAPTRAELADAAFPEEAWDGIQVLHRPAGCGACGQTGFRGRLGVYEVMPVSEEIERMALERVPSEEIRRVAISEGMIPMRADGLEKARLGITSVQEVLRVVA